MHLQGDSFFQSNHALTPALARWHCNDFAGETLLDLYGGLGLFGIHHGPSYSHVTLVEISRKMARRGTQNYTENGISSYSAQGMPAERFFSRRNQQFDTVIVDPPRNGLSKKVRQGIVNAGAKRIIYISCNPATQARDLNFFVNKCNFRIADAAFFDMYPHTPHMETAVLLTP
ncbi:MAG: hypothetical protein ACQEQV_10060 [Fibrobacterota bacterium]